MIILLQVVSLVAQLLIAATQISPDEIPDHSTSTIVES